MIFEVDSLILAKELARHLPWACRSENLIALHQQCAHVCDSLSALHISWDIRHIYREFNQIADTLSNQAIDERDSNGFSAFLVVFYLHIMFTCRDSWERTRPPAGAYLEERPHLFKCFSTPSCCQLRLHVLGVTVSPVAQGSQFVV